MSKLLVPTLLNLDFVIKKMVGNATLILNAFGINAPKLTKSINKLIAKLFGKKNGRAFAAVKTIDTLDLLVSPFTGSDKGTLTQRVSSFFRKLGHWLVDIIIKNQVISIGLQISNWIVLFFFRQLDLNLALAMEDTTPKVGVLPSWIYTYVFPVAMFLYATKLSLNEMLTRDKSKHNSYVKKTDGVFGFILTGIRKCSARFDENEAKILGAAYSAISEMTHLLLRAVVAVKIFEFFSMEDVSSLHLVTNVMVAFATVSPVIFLVAVSSLILCAFRGKNSPILNAAAVVPLAVVVNVMGKTNEIQTLAIEFAMFFASHITIAITAVAYVMIGANLGSLLLDKLIGKDVKIPKTPKRPEFHAAVNDERKLQLAEERVLTDLLAAEKACAKVRESTVLLQQITADSAKTLQAAYVVDAPRITNILSCIDSSRQARVARAASRAASRAAGRGAVPHPVVTGDKEVVFTVVGVVDHVEGKSKLVPKSAAATPGSSARLGSALSFK